MVTTMTPDVNVVLVDFKVPGREMVVENEDGSYTILINSRLSYEGQYRAYKHGMQHITENDFEKSNVQQIEAVAHNEAVHTKNIQIHENAEYIPSEKYEEHIKRLRKKQKRIRKEQKKYAKKILFLQENGLDNFFEQAERNYLYGNEL